MTHLMYFLAALIVIDRAKPAYSLLRRYIAWSRKFDDDPENETQVF